MNQTEIIEIIREAIILTIQIGAPPMLIGLVVGVSIALLQALTQVQEMTLVFVPKILTIFLALFVLLPFMVSSLTNFMEVIAERIISG